MANTDFKDFEDYFSQFPEEIQVLLEQMRQAIHQAAPDAEEVISYQMPTFKLIKNLVHFAAFSHHIGFYPGASGVAAFPAEVSKFKNAKGSIQFPMDQPLPLDLVKKITEFRVKENLKKFKK